MSSKRRKVAYCERQKIGLDVWKKIFGYLETDDELLKILVLVCKEWAIEKLCSIFTLSNHIIPMNKLTLLPAVKCLNVHFKNLWQNEQHDFWIDDEFQKQQFLQNCRHFKTITLNSVMRLDMSGFTACHKLSVPDYSRFIKLPPNLEILITCYVDVIETDLLASQMPFLHTLYLEIEDTLNENHLLLFQFFPHLTNLAFDSSLIHNISNLQYSTSLKRLQLGHMEPTKYLGLDDLTRLMRLDVSLPSIETEHLSKLCCLKTLILHQVKREDDLTSIVFDENLTNLLLVDVPFDTSHLTSCKLIIYELEDIDWHEVYFHFNDVLTKQTTMA